MFTALQKVYQGKKVFLTGHTGFKGAWLLKTLSMMGAEVKGYALAPLNDIDLYHLIKGDALCDSVIDDIRNRAALTKAVQDFQPDFVFHLAAQPLVRLSYQVPSETFEINAIGSANVLDAVRLLEKSCQVIMITTDKVYSNHEWIYPYRENDKLGGYDPYSASKACAELLIDSYRNSFFHVAEFEKHRKAIAVARAGNVIGGGDWSKDRLIPDIARAIGAGEQVIVRKPTSVRPWQHVLEPLSGYLLLGARLSDDPVSYSQPYNFGPYNEDALSVKEMVETAIKAWGKGDYKVQKVADGLHEAGLLKLDISKVINEVGWKPRLKADEAVRLTVNWYKEYYNDKDKIDAYTQMQIMNYFND